MIGHIKIDRKILNWEWYSDCKMVHLFLHLLVKANWVEGTWRGIKIKRGQYMTSVSKLSGSTGLSVSQIRTCLGKLQTTGEIATKMTNLNTLITICKYETYQSEKNNNSKQFDKQNDNPVSNPDSNNIRIQEDKKDNTTTAVVEMGIVFIKEIANEVWKDKKWIEELCIGCGLTSVGAKDWMRQFNLSISQDTIEGFNAKRYKKMFQGWLRVKLGGGQKVTKLKDADAETKEMMQKHGL